VSNDDIELPIAVEIGDRERVRRHFPVRDLDAGRERAILPSEIDGDTPFLVDGDDIEDSVPVEIGGYSTAD